MGTQSVWGYSEIQGVKTNKLEHKVSLVTPRMDVDVTGVSLKNVRTHIIDRPRDDGRKHREQLWSFQQRYRGAIGKLRNLPSLTAEETRNEDVLSDIAADDDISISNSRSVTSDKISLQSRFKRRLSQKGSLTRIKTNDLIDPGKGKHSKEQNDDDSRTSSSVRRQYSSGFVVKNSLYNQLRSIDNEGNKPRDDARILEAIEKFGSLERLPDIPYVGGPIQSPLRFLKSVNGFSRRLTDFSLDRRLSSMQRANTNIPISRSNRRKLLIVSRRGHKERVVRLGCIDSDNDDDEEEENEEEDDEEDEYDECENGKQNGRTGKPPNKLRIDHQIRNNITPINSQDDMALLQHVLDTSDVEQRAGFRTERTFNHGDGKPAKLFPRVEAVKLSKSSSVGNLHTAASSGEDSDQQQKSCAKKTKDSGKDVANNEVLTKVAKESNSNRLSTKAHKSNKKTKPEVKGEEEVCESDDSLDIPDDRFGHTTHTIDKKLAIRKPWEWRPCPFRWIDKAYVRESDKPYIERILNKGEVIDHFNYDSFARTKPLKIQNYPENAGYKDRNGVMR